MKKIITLLGFIALLSSCSTAIESVNPEKETTVEIQQKAKEDTLVYKVVIIDNTLYAVNNNLVKVKVTNYDIDDVILTTIVITVVIILILLFVIAFPN